MFLFQKQLPVMGAGHRVYIICNAASNRPPGRRGVAQDTADSRVFCEARRFGLRGSMPLQKSFNK